MTRDQRDPAELGEFLRHARSLEPGTPLSRIADVWNDTAIPDFADGRTGPLCGLPPTPEEVDRRAFDRLQVALASAVQEGTGCVIVAGQAAGPGLTFEVQAKGRATGTCGHPIYPGARAISAPHGLFCSPDCASRPASVPAPGDGAAGAPANEGGER